MPDDHSGDLSWLTDWVTDQRARTPAEPLIDPWAGDSDEAPPGTHPASQPSDPDVAPKAGRDAENTPPDSDSATDHDPAGPELHQMLSPAFDIGQNLDAESRTRSRRRPGSAEGRGAPYAA